MLKREIEELALKDKTQKVSFAAKSLMESDEVQSQKQDAALIGELRDNVLLAICEVNALKNAVLTKNEAEEQAKMEYLTQAERELWQNFKEATAQKKHWETFAANLHKPPDKEKEALRTYEEISKGVAQKLDDINANLQLLLPRMKKLEEKLSAPGLKSSIQKAAHQILMGDRRNRDKLKKANEHLENAVEALRQVVYADAAKVAKRKIFATGQIYEILRREYYGLKREYQKSLDLVATLKKKVISPSRALSMAKDVYTKGATKKLRADLRSLKKQEAKYPKEREYLLRELERLNAPCQTPTAKGKIEEIAAGILRKNARWAKKYAEAEKRCQDLADKLHQTQRRLNAVKLWLSLENPRTRYQVVKPKADAAVTSSNTALTNSAVAIIADAMLGKPEAVQLVARSSGDGLETEKTWTLMTKLDREALRMKALMRDL